MKKLFNLLLFVLISLTAAAQTSDKQEVTIKYSPADALVMVDGDMVDSQAGLATISLSVGEHSYSIVANGYYQQNGVIVVKKDKPCNVVVELLPKEGTKPRSQSVAKPKPEAAKNNSNATTSATVLSNVELTLQDFINNPLGFIVCDGDKWTMTPDILHEALKKSKMKCVHTTYPGIENMHNVKQSNIKRTYRGQKIAGMIYADNESFDEYCVQLVSFKEKDVLQFKKNILEDFNTAGITMEQSSNDDFRSNIAKFRQKFIKQISVVYVNSKFVAEHMPVFHAEDENNRYELYHSYIKGSGRHYCMLIVSKK